MQNQRMTCSSQSRPHRTHRPFAHRLGIATALVFTVGLLSCGGQPEREAAQERTADQTAPDMAPDRQMAPGSPVEIGEGVNRVDVTLNEFRIEMPESIPAGPTAFVVSNVGMAEHNFEIIGEGFEERLGENLTHGETRVMQVDLRPGAYHVHCPVGNHEQQGMMVNLIVR